MIEGLRVTISGEEPRRLLEDRIDDHRASAERWAGEHARTVKEQTGDAPLLPDRMCPSRPGATNGAPRCSSASAIGSSRRRRPPKPFCVEQAEHEERLELET